MRSRVIGRVLAENARDLPAGTLLDEKHVDALLTSGITAVRVRSPFTCEADMGICCHCYGRDLATGKLVRRGVAVGIIAGQSIGEPGTQLTMRTFHSGGIANAQGDITQGLPRVSELFEARIPKGAALLSEVEGTVQLEKRADTGETIIQVTGEGAKEYKAGSGQSLQVSDGQTVFIGTPLTVGPCNPKQLLDLMGREAVARYLVNEVQRVYRGTGVYISDKHVEVIVRQMLRSVFLSDPGDTDLLPGDTVHRTRLLQANREILAQGGDPARVRPLLFGLTKTALNTASWVAAASFQETSKVLTRAAITAQTTFLDGYKEQILIGGQIPHIV
jgi:DNA-directed RNA polymerase subunit beta'